MSKKEKKIKEVRQSLIKVGDSFKETYDSTKDLKQGMLAVRSYANATKTAMVQVHYKRLTGTPVKIEFLEED
jgi:hypothetical protein